MKLIHSPLAICEQSIMLTKTKSNSTLKKQTFKHKGFASEKLHNGTLTSATKQKKAPAGDGWKPCSARKAANSSPYSCDHSVIIFQAHDQKHKQWQRPCTSRIGTDHGTHKSIKRGSQIPATVL
jgi:hypothetical protein